MSTLSIICALLSPFVAFLLSKKIGLIDYPNNKVKLHPRAVPYIGGVSSLLIFLIFTFNYGFDLRVLLVTCFAVIGIIDDKINIKPIIRFLFELIFSFCLVINIIPNLNIPIVIILTLLGVTIVNSLNFIDIKDGLATSYSFALLIYLVNIPGEYNNFLFYLFYLLCSLLSIYWLNSEPAKAYQGDGGSYAIAASTFTSFLFIFAKLDSFDFVKVILNKGLIEAIPYDKNFVYSLTLIVAFFPILFEMGFVVYQRLSKNLSPFKASNDHIALRLQTLGYSSYKISVIFMLLPLFSFFVLINSLQEIISLSIFLIFGFVIIFCYKFLKRL